MSYLELERESMVVRLLSDRFTILSLVNDFKGAMLSRLFLLKFKTIKLVHSDNASIFPIAWFGILMVNITSTENLLLMVFRIGTVTFPERWYFYFWYWVKSLNFSMFMSDRLAPNSFQLILLSVFFPEGLCFDIIFKPLVFYYLYNRFNYLYTVI